MRFALVAALTATAALAVAGLAAPAATPARPSATPPEVRVFEITIDRLPVQAGDDVKLTVVVKLSDGRNVSPTRTTCLAGLAGKPLATRVGRGICRVKVPQNAKGKSLAIALHLSYGDVSVDKTLTYRVHARPG